MKFVTEHPEHPVELLLRVLEIHRRPTTGG